jgi:hypothetical protein
MSGAGGDGSDISKSIALPVKSAPLPVVTGRSIGGSLKVGSANFTGAVTGVLPLGSVPLYITKPKTVTAEMSPTTTSPSLVFPRPSSAIR